MAMHQYVRENTLSHGEYNHEASAVATFVTSVVALTGMFIYGNRTKK